MPLNKAYLPKVDGLQTETAPISSDPRSLADCVDIISDVQDSIESRHGHPIPSLMFEEGFYALYPQNTPTDLYAYKSETEKFFIGISKNISTNLYRYFSFSTETEELDNTATATGSSEIDGKTITRLSPVNTKPSAFAHDERLLFLTDYGVYYAGSSPVTSYTEKVDFPKVRTANIESEWLPSDTLFTDAEQENRHWLLPGNQVNVKIVVEIEAKQTKKGERILLSPPSRTYEVKNFNLANVDNAKRTSNTLVSINGLTLSNTPKYSDYKVTYYRTLQFPIGEAELTEYFYAGEEQVGTDIEYTNARVDLQDGSTILGEEAVGMVVNNDGSKLYVTTSQEDEFPYRIYLVEYILSTPYDLSSAQLGVIQTDKFTSGSGKQIDFCYGEDGFSIHRLVFRPSDPPNSADRFYIQKHTLTSRWDVKTASFYPDGLNILIDFDGVPDSLRRAPTGLAFSDDGLHFFVSGGLEGSFEPFCIGKWTMDTAWDVSTASFSELLDLSDIVESPRDLQFSSNGDYLLVLGPGYGDFPAIARQTATVSVFKLNQPYSLSNVIYQYTTLIDDVQNFERFWNDMLLVGDSLYVGGNGNFGFSDYPPVVYQFAITNLSNSVYLTANDDIVRTFEPLYTNPSQGGFPVTNRTPIPAKNVTEFLNYYIYSCITPPTITQFGLKQLPKDGETLTLRLSGAAGVTPIEKTVTFKNTPGLIGFSQVKIAANSTSLTSNYLSTEDDLTFRGLRETDDQDYDVVVKIVPGSGQGEVEAYGQINSYEGILPSGANATIRVVPSAVGFDVNKFNQPGIAAIVDTSGKILHLFSYNNVRRVSSSVGFIDFEGGVSVGGKDMPTTKTSGEYYMYSIDATNLQTTIESSPNVNTTISNLTLFYGNGSSYLSLLPCKNSIVNPVGQPAPIPSNTAIFDYDTNGELVVNPFYIGLLNKPQGKLLDDMSIAIADSFQNLFNELTPVVNEIPPTPVLACTAGQSNEKGVLSAEILDPTYEVIEFRRGVNSTDIYEPVIETTNTEFARSEADKSAFVISKQNNPELIPYGGTSDIAGPYVTTKVGNRDKAIVACATTKDSIYFLKEDGIARLSIIPGALVPLVDSIYFFDNTTFCVSAGSVQNFQDSIIFLAQDGVYTLSGTSIQKVSFPIEKELKTAISECRALNKQGDIRSFSNDAKALYGITIPLTGDNFVTYVLSMATMRWTKWSINWKGAVVDADGRLTTFFGDSVYNNLRQDKYTDGNPYNPIDQVDNNIPLNFATVTDIGNDRGFSESDIGLTVSRTILNKDVYYRQSNGTLTKVIVTVINDNLINVAFPSIPPTFNPNDSLIVGVNVSLTFNPFTGNNPSDLKMFSGFHIHTLNNVKTLKCSFRTEARSTFSTVTSFSVSPTDRNVYRCNIPLEAVRGRYIYRKIEHTQPFEIFSMPAQTIVYRDTGSVRVNKNA